MKVRASVKRICSKCKVIRRQRVVLARIDGGHEDAQAFVYLRRGEADAVILVHGVDHVIDQFLDRRLLELGGFEFSGPRSQHRMPHAGDLQDGHL